MSMLSASTWDSDQPGLCLAALRSWGKFSIGFSGLYASEPYRVCDSVGEPRQLDLALVFFPLREERENETQSRGLMVSIIEGMGNMPQSWPFGFCC